MPERAFGRACVCLARDRHDIQARKRAVVQARRIQKIKLLRCSSGIFSGMPERQWPTRTITTKQHQNSRAENYTWVKPKSRPTLRVRTIVILLCNEIRDTTHTADVFFCKYSYQRGSAGAVAGSRIYLHSISSGVAKEKGKI